MAGGRTDGAVPEPEGISVDQVHRFGAVALLALGVAAALPGCRSEDARARSDAAAADSDSAFAALQHRSAPPMAMGVDQ